LFYLQNNNCNCSGNFCYCQYMTFHMNKHFLLYHLCIGLTFIFYIKNNKYFYSAFLYTSNIIENIIDILTTLKIIPICNLDIYFYTYIIILVQNHSVIYYYLYILKRNESVLSKRFRCVSHRNLSVRYNTSCCFEKK